MGNDLIIILKNKWFEQIKNGSKKEEYRLYKKYWINKLINRQYNNIIFQNGYKKNAEKIIKNYIGYEIKNIFHEEFGGLFETKVFVIKFK